MRRYGLIKIFKNLKKIDWLYIFICIGLIVFSVWLDLTMPDYTKKLTAAVSAGAIVQKEVWKNGGMMLLCAFGSMTAAIATGWFSSHIAANFAKTLRSKLFDKISTFTDREINRFTTPSLITRTTNDVVQMQMLVAMGMQAMIKAPILAIWAIGKISSTSIEWTSATLITVAVMIGAIGLVVGLCYPKFKRIQKLTDALNEITRESITGVRVVRAFNAEEYQENKFEKVNTAVTSNQLFTSRAMGVMMPVMTVCMSGLTLAIYWIGAVLMNKAAVLDRVVVLGDMTAFTQYALQVVMAFMMLVMIFVIMPRAMVSSKRINEVLDTEPSIEYAAEPAETDRVGEFEFRNVSFAYPDSATPCLSGLSFKIERGETFAIIGATGAGKTTLIDLLPRYYDCTEGEVLIDGVNVKELTKEQIERRISLAPQKAVLFKGDIKSNITYGGDADDARIERALRISQSTFVEDKTDGILSEVAQGGANFSGGQKQRLSIARAVYKDAEIYIFDDTFSALDYKTDMLVRKAIREEMSDKTVVIVAQRIGTIKNADRILVLDNGKAVGLGKHDELLRTCPVYKDIALSQLSKEEL